MGSYVWLYIGITIIYIDLRMMINSCNKNSGERDINLAKEIDNINKKLELNKGK